MIMKKLLDLILSRLPVFKQLNGYKTYIAAALILLGALDTALVDIINLFPEAQYLITAKSLLLQAVQGLGRLAEILGIPVLAVAVAHNKIKGK